MGKLHGLSMINFLKIDPLLAQDERDILASCLVADVAADAAACAEFTSENETTTRRLPSRILQLLEPNQFQDSLQIP